MKRFIMVVAAAGVLIGLAAPAQADVRRAFLRASRRTRTSSPPEAGTSRRSSRGTSRKIDFEVNYADLKGGTPPSPHIHFGKRGVNGGIMAFLCGGGGQGACPATTSGTFSGTILPANVQAIANQGTTAGILDELIAAMRRGRAYVNIHNDTFMPGEIRGQIR